MEELFKVIANALDDAILIFDQERKLIFFNQKAKEFFLLDESFLGLPLDEFWKIENLKFLFYLLGKGLREIQKEDVELKDKIFQTSSISLFQEGKKIGNLVLFRDVTRERKVEKLKSEFVSLSAHQLRTPLSGIYWALDSILKKKEISSEDREILFEATKKIEQMIRLISELLDVVKLEEGSWVYKVSEFDLAKLTKEVVELFKDAIKEKGLQFSLEVERNLPKVRGDKEKIRLVIQNLLDNAIRYNFQGGQIKIEIKRSGEKEVEFSISDTGIGIPENQKNQIFRKFFRASNAIKKETEGSGLGLFMAKNIIESQQGKIWFESIEGEGSTFYFTLPTK
ncbi:PAS domain-containing sensor histidine kinase [Candidatus Parcubacteria bacterium]|nr:PAS domain-containing sensor histidine kinase [Candidatus Parcubacteria bacterium]